MISEDISKNQNEFFDRHPFPGMVLDDGIDPAHFAYTLEKNHTYRLIKKLLKPTDRLVDVGCGTGEFTNYLALYSGARVVGLDYSQPTLDWAKRIQNQLEIKNAEFDLQDIFAPSDEYSGSFDIALAMGLFPSIPDQQVAMNNIVKMLKIGGTAIFGYFDPVGRLSVRMKRRLLQMISSDFSNQEKICRDVICRHMDNESEIKWIVNQLTEEFLVYHSPKKAIEMMHKSGLVVTDSFPSLSVFGGLDKSQLQTTDPLDAKLYKQFPIQMGWLFAGLSGYYVVVGRRVEA